MIKRVFQVLTAALLVATACTREKAVYGEHEVGATIEQTKDKEEFKAAYIVVDDVTSNAQSDAQLLAYLTQNDVKLAILANLEARDMETNPLSAELKETFPHMLVVKHGTKMTLALAQQAITPATEIPQGVLSCGVLHFEYAGIRFVANTLVEKALPSSGEGESGNEGEGTGSNQPNTAAEDANCTLRAEQAEYLVAQTINNLAYHEARHWVFLLDTNAPSPLDVQHGHEFSEQACAANAAFIYHGLVDCVANSSYIYTPSSSDNSREHMLYTTAKTWNNISKVAVDNNVVTQHYPILFTLKSEE